MIMRMMVAPLLRPFERTRYRGRCATRGQRLLSPWHVLSSKSTPLSVGSGPRASRRQQKGWLADAQSSDLWLGPRIG